MLRSFCFCPFLLSRFVFFLASQVVMGRKVLEVHITKGMRNGQKITFHGEADEAPGVIPGDVIFIVEEKVRFWPPDLATFRFALSALPFFFWTWTRLLREPCPWCTGVEYGPVLEAKNYIFCPVRFVSRFRCRRTTLSSDARVRTWLSRRPSPWWRRCAGSTSPSRIWTSECSESRATLDRLVFLFFSYLIRGQGLLRGCTFSQKLTGLFLIRFSAVHLNALVLPFAQVTKHDDVFMLDGEGMPTVSNPFVRGRLFVIFKVPAA